MFALFAVVPPGAMACELGTAGRDAVTSRSSQPAPTLEPEDVVTEGGTIPVKIVGGRLVAHVELSTIHSRVPTNLLEGMPFQPRDGRMTIPFSRSLAAVAQANADYLKRIEAEGAGTIQTFAAKMAPRQLTVVAYVKDGSSKKLLQAIQVNPRQPQATEIDTPE